MCYMLKSYFSLNIKEKRYRVFKYCFFSLVFSIFCLHQQWAAIGRTENGQPIIRVTVHSDQMSSPPTNAGDMVWSELGKHPVHRDHIWVSPTRVYPLRATGRIYYWIRFFLQWWCVLWMDHLLFININRFFCLTWSTYIYLFSSLSPIFPSYVTIKHKCLMFQILNLFQKLYSC